MSNILNYSLGMVRNLAHEFTVDFYELKLGRAHQMRFGAYSLYSQKPNSSDTMLSQVK